MEKNKEKTPEQQQYEKMQQQYEIKRPILKNCLRAFIAGGIICCIGQAITYVFIYFSNFTEQTASNPTVATMVFLSMLLTGFSLYDRIGQFSGAGSAVPVTGFGNAIISAAIEHRTEGFILGIGGNMFKLAGAVIVYGVFSAFIVALIKTAFIQWGVI